MKCKCGHTEDEHPEAFGFSCLYEYNCDCKKFQKETMGSVIDEQIAKLKKKVAELEAKKRVIDLPQPKSVIDTKSIIEFAVLVRDEVESGKWHDDNDNDHYAYETLMEAVFGREFWDWMNKKT